MQAKYKKPKKDFSPKIPPVGFVTDSGQWFDIQIVKPTVKCLWIKLLGPDGKIIKVRKTSKKLKYQKES